MILFVLILIYYLYICLSLYINLFRNDVESESERNSVNPLVYKWIHLIRSGAQTPTWIPNHQLKLSPT